ncbi:MAG TPA: hypothetical protein VF053_21795 [Streptosporangiales bacterium]
MRLDDIAGVSLREVIYYVLPDLADESMIRHGDRHDVSMGIEFRTEGGGAFTVSWVTEGLDARVEVDLGPSAERYGDAKLTAVAATGWPEWRQALGRRVTAVTGLQGLKPAEEGLTQVGVRLGFDDGGVTVALGEVDGQGALAYSPNNLVVLFDEAEATAYAASLAEET